MSDILYEAERLLGPAVKVHWHRNWAVFWCPFHPDREGSGHRSGPRPNFGVNLVEGYWKCLRCGASGGSIQALERALGRGHYRKPAPKRRARPQETTSPIPTLVPAVAAGRYALWHFDAAASARAYLDKRGVSRATAVEYGLGFGLARPPVDTEVVKAAEAANLAVEGKRGLWWLWSGGIVYADPPDRPQVVQVRHLRPKATKKYQMWGVGRNKPLGTWRITANTEVLLVVEGLFDMLVFAEHLRRRRLFGQVVPVSLGGATPPAAVLDWLARWPRALIFVPDPDEAGIQAVERIREARDGDDLVAVPPDGLDPDEAVLSGWWPW